MSTGGGTGYNPRDVYNQDSSDKSLLDKIKDAVKPSKHTSTGPTAGRPAAYDQEASHSRPQEGVQHDQYENTMPDHSDMRHQGQDTSGGITNALKPGRGSDGPSSSGQAARGMTDSMGSSVPKISRKLEGGLGSDPGSVGQGR